MLPGRMLLFPMAALLTALLSTGCDVMDNLTIWDDESLWHDGGHSQPTHPCQFRPSSLPLPTGPYCIGATDYHFVDSQRPELFTPEDDTDFREVMVRLFYPAQAGGGEYGDYMDESSIAAVAAGSDVPNVDDAIRTIAVQFRINAPPAGHRASFPLLIFSPGLGCTFQEYTALIEDMVSHGYVVAAINHPWISRITVFPDGHETPVYPFSPSNYEDFLAFINENFPVVVGDMQLVLDKLIGLNQTNHLLNGRIDFCSVGAFGHSYGGAASLALIDVDSRVSGGINMDGAMAYPGMGTEPVDTPFLIHLAGPHTAASDPSVSSVWQRGINDKWLAYVETAAHGSYLDWPVLYGGLTDGGSMGEDAQGTIDPVLMLQLVRDSNRGFFDAYLKDRHVNPDTLEARYPEAVLYSAADSLPLN